MSASSETRPHFEDSAEKIPALVQDPFDAHALLDLAAADMPNFKLVDGTVALAADQNMPFVVQGI